MTLLRSALALGAASLLAGCATMNAIDDLPPRAESHAPVPPLVQAPLERAATGSIFRPGAGSPLASPARRVAPPPAVTLLPH